MKLLSSLVEYPISCTNYHQDETKTTNKKLSWQQKTTHSPQDGKTST